MLVLNENGVPKKCRCGMLNLIVAATQGDQGRHRRERLREIWENIFFSFLPVYEFLVQLKQKRTCAAF